MAATRDTDDPTAGADRLASALIAGLPVTERWLQVADVSTPVLQGGQGPPVVLLHGQGGFAQMWGGMIPHLIGTHRVVAPDLPGLGRSTVGLGKLDVSLAVDWLGDLIAQTCAEPPTLVGTSLGGSFAANFAVLHSDRLRGVVLIDSGSLARFRPALGPLPALIRYKRRPNPDTYERFFRQVVAHPDRVRAAMGDRWAAAQAYHIDRTNQPGVRAANRQLLKGIGMKRIPDEQLRKITVPVALIWGRNDRVMRFRIAEEASAKFGWPLYPIDDCGHASVMERPDAVLGALRAAIDGRP